MKLHRSKYFFFASYNSFLMIFFICPLSTLFGSMTIQCRKSKDQDLIALRHWVDKQEQDVRSGAMAKRRDRLNKLQALGLPFKLTWEQEWDYYILELLKFRSKYGHCFVNTFSKDYPGLDRFVSELLGRLRKDSPTKLSKDEENDLHQKGLILDLDKMLKNPNGRPPSNSMYVAEATSVPLEKVTELNYWAGMLGLLKAYKKKYNTLKIPPPMSEEDRINEMKDPKVWAEINARNNLLEAWVRDQQKSHENKTLDQSRIKELQKIGLLLDSWEAKFKELKKYKREAGTVRLTHTLKNIETEEDKKTDELGKWIHHQVRIYRRGGLDKEKKKKLRDLGVTLTKKHLGSGTWEERFDEMMDFYHAHKTCLPKRNGPLREWVIALVNSLQNNEYMSERRLKIINARNIGPYLKPEVVYADNGKDSSTPNSKKRGAGTDISGGEKKTKTI